jgi:hypothetical protein
MGRKLMVDTAIQSAGRLLSGIGAVAATLLLFWQHAALALPEFTSMPTQYIAALGNPDAKSGSGAQDWGLWVEDPGPRGVRLSKYEALKAAGGVTPAKWTFDNADWWLEEHGLIMEQPVFPIPPGTYVVTGGREATALLTIHPKAEDGSQRWELSDNASIYDVTHLRCRAARYTPASGGNSCSPEKAQQASFPVAPGATMPAVDGCKQQDYQVLIVMGMVKGE